MADTRHLLQLMVPALPACNSEWEELINLHGKRMEVSMVHPEDQPIVDMMKASIKKHGDCKRLARDLDVSQCMLSNFLSGRTRITPKVLKFYGYERVVVSSVRKIEVVE